MRKSRQEIAIAKEEALEYMDPLQFGSASDPCFGKLYSLTDPACQACADSVFCANKVKLSLGQAVLKDNADYLDTEVKEALEASAAKYIKKKLSKGRPHSLIIKLAKRKFKLPKKAIINIINKHSG